MIRIAFVIDTIESPTAGTEKQLLLLIKHLDRTRFQPYLCVLRTSEWLEREFDLCPLFVAHIHSFKQMSSLRGIVRLSRYFRDEGIGIVQVHFRDSSIAGILAAKLAGVGVIVATRRNQGYWYTPRELMLQKLLNRWVSLFIANSENTREWAIRTEGIDPERIKVIHNGVDLAPFQQGTAERPAAFRAGLGFPADAVLVGIVANLRKVKAHDVFLRAAKNVAEKVPLARFVIIGDGPERPTLEYLCTELELNTHVRFLGKRTDIPAILACLDIGVLSSSSESFSNAIVEYMAAGLPVLTTDVGGAREAVDDGINGFIVPVGDFDEMGQRIIELLKADTIKEMGQESRKRSLERFALTSMIEKTEHLYDRCLKGSN